MVKGVLDEKNPKLNNPTIIRRVIFTIWNILIILVLFVDIKYWNYKDNGYSIDDINCLLRCIINQGREWKISYSNLYDSLGGYNSVLLSVVGMIITGWINVSNRMEQSVYGIRRRELYYHTSCLMTLIGESYVGVYLAPLWMIFAIFKGYSLTAYFTLLLIYFELILGNVLAATTYNHSKDVENLCKVIKAVSKEKGLGEYRSLIDRITLSLNKNINWDEIYKIYWQTLEEEEIENKFEVIYIFVDNIFKEENANRLVDFIIKYTVKIGKDSASGEEVRYSDTDFIGYWILLKFIYERCSEKDIIRFMDNMLRIFNLKFREEYYDFSVSEESLSVVLFMITLQSELWLDKNDSEIQKFADKLMEIVQTCGALYFRNRNAIQTNTYRLIERQQEAEESIEDGKLQEYYKRINSMYAIDEKDVKIGLVESLLDILQD